jgi:hypothetical protein
MARFCFKYLIGIGLFCSSEVSASMENPVALQQLRQNLQISDLNEGMLVQMMLNWIKSIPGSNETKLSTFLAVFEEHRQQITEKVMEEENRINAIKKEIMKERAEIATVWGSLEAWGDICKIFEGSSYDIAGMLFSDSVNPQFFSGLCTQWIEVLTDKNPQQIAGITALGGFQYSLAIMLIYAETLFADRNLEPLKHLWVAAGYKEDGCNFEDLEGMKATGMEIMRSAANYHLAYEFLGNGE